MLHAGLQAAAASWEGTLSMVIVAGQDDRKIEVGSV